MKRLGTLHTAELIVLAFAGAILLGSLLRWLPISTTGSGNGSYLTAIFTSTSPETTIREGDILVVAGDTKRVDELVKLRG